MLMMSKLLRWAVATAALLFGGACLALAIQGALRWDVRLGLQVFLAVQSGLYVATAFALMNMRWRALTVLLLGLGLVQLVYAAEVTPPASLLETFTGIVGGGLGLTILVAAAAAAVWAMSTLHRPGARPFLTHSRR